MYLGDGRGSETVPRDSFGSSLLGQVCALRVRHSVPMLRLMIRVHGISDVIKVLGV